jgi:hypothetical protein
VGSWPAGGALVGFFFLSWAHDVSERERKKQKIWEFDLDSILRVGLRI